MIRYEYGLPSPVFPREENLETWNFKPMNQLYFELSGLFMNNLCSKNGKSLKTEITMKQNAHSLS